MTVGGSLSPLAFGLALAAPFRWAFGNVPLKRIEPPPAVPPIAWLRPVPPLPVLLAASFDGFGQSLLGAIATAPWRSLAAVLYPGGASTILADAIWGRLLTRYAAARVTPFTLLAPCAGVIASAMIAGERFSATRHVGMTLIFAGLAATPLRVKHPAYPASVTKTGGDSG